MRIRWIYFILLCLLAQQCAKQTAPTGGPTDETPPTLEASTPQHEQTNVKNSKLTLTFDEAIQLNNPREEIIITPSVGKKFEVTYNKNKVELDLKTDLKENTTYNINFREAIQDLTEKNPATVKLAFSTGSYIDSLSINGKVMDALTEKLAFNFTVVLAEASDTFSIFKHPASWITLTNKKGLFSLENLKPGNYIIYAFDDKSKNLIVDSKSEKYGFIGQPIQLTKNADSLRINIFKLDINKLKLITARSTFAYFNLRFSKSLIDYTITAADSSTKVYSTLESDLTTVKLYNTIPDLDSLQIKVHASDSLNNTIDTLVYMKFPKKESTRDKLAVKNESASVQENNSSSTTSVVFSKPITTFSPDSIFIEVDSLTRIHFLKEDFQWDSRLTRLTINKKIPPSILFPVDTSKVDPEIKPAKKTTKKETSIIFKKGSFISIEKDTAVSLTTRVNLLKLEATAILETKVDTKENFIIQILNKNGIILHERLNQKESSFENLPPDTYIIRAVIDLNKNGKWDPGDFFTRREPEPIIYYRNPKGIKDVSLKANWHLGPLLITY
jgi:uncharacterized protein (DUF2141 family)